MFERVLNMPLFKNARSVKVHLTIDWAENTVKTQKNALRDPTTTGFTWNHSGLWVDEVVSFQSWDLLSWTARIYKFIEDK